MVTVFAHKKENNLKLKKSLGLLLKYKPLWLIKLTNSDILSGLTECLKVLPAWFVIYTEGVKTEILSKNIVITWDLEDSVLSWFDFLVCDDEITNVNKYIEGWVTPIINRGNHLEKILKEFDPLKNLWNSFIYDESNVYSIFFTIVRYVENYKFPYDNKNLVKNLLKV